MQTKNSKRPVRLLATAALLALGAASVQAQSSYTSPGSSYMELKGGESNFGADCGVLYHCDNKSNLYGVSFGKQVSPNYGYEMGYTNFGKMDRGGGETKAQGVNLSVVGRLPIDRLAFFAKLGATYAQTETSTPLISDVRHGNGYGWGANYGAGVSFDVTPGFAVLAQWEETHMKFAGDENERVNGVNVGLRFKF